MVGRLVSVNVGLPRDVAWRGQTVRTAVWKEAVQGRRMVRKLNVEGDQQGDLAGHGGENRAVMVYQMDSYHYWESFLGRTGFALGQFGENFTVEGLSDQEVFVGDRYQIGGAVFEVTQPRVTCYRVGIRMAEPALPALLVSHHRPGFYFRVLKEGDVGSGDEITRIADGPERMSVAKIDALLYLPGHSQEQLDSALRIQALSPGWKNSLKALADQPVATAGNPGLTASTGPQPAWPGFRSLRVSRIDRESSNVISLSLENPDGCPLPAALPGQFLVLRLHVTAAGPPILRNYSLSGMPGANAYRVSVKHEDLGTASSFLHGKVSTGDVLECSAPRGSFTLRSGDEPVILASAGIGATPLLAMLHSLAAGASNRKVWWLYGARNGTEHPFATESRELVKLLSRARSHIVYSKPEPMDQPGQDFNTVGHLDAALLGQLGVLQNSDFYLCGPPSFLHSLTEGLRQWGADSARVHSEVFGPEAPITPGIASNPKRSVHLPVGAPEAGPRISFTRSGLTIPWDSRFVSILELAEACDVPVRWSCRTGVCHTCECALIGGAVAYQPVPLEPPKGGNVLICCSQPAGDLELDL